MKHLMGLIVIALVSQFSAAQAFWGDDWLSLYACENETDSRICKSCRLSELKVRFVVDRQKRSVITQYREKSMVNPPSEHTNCVVIDTKNWSCESKAKSFVQSDGMANGIFSFKRDFLNAEGATYFTAFSCAK